MSQPDWRASNFGRAGNAAAIGVEAGALTPGSGRPGLLPNWAWPKNRAMTMAKTRIFDAAEYLDSPEMIAEYLTEALETDDDAFIAKAISIVARALGMGVVAEAAGVDRTNLYRALSGDAKPEFETIRNVLGALGVQLVAKPRAASLPRLAWGGCINLHCSDFFPSCQMAAGEGPFIRRPNQGPSSRRGGGNGTRRQKSPRSTVYCTGGPFSERKNHTS